MCVCEYVDIYAHAIQDGTKYSQMRDLHEIPDVTSMCAIRIYVNTA